MGVPNGYTSAQVVQAVPTGIQSALVFITGGTITNSTSVDNCFSATYLNYKVVFSNLVSGDASAVNVRMRVGGSNNSSSLYSYINNGQSTSSGATMDLGVARDTNLFQLGYDNGFANGQSLSIDFFSPFSTTNTHYGPGIFWNDEVNYAGVIAGVHKSATSFDGFTIYPLSSTLAGTYKIYGYANS